WKLEFIASSQHSAEPERSWTSERFTPCRRCALQHHLEKLFSLRVRCKTTIRICKCNLQTQMIIAPRGNVVILLKRQRVHSVLNTFLFLSSRVIASGNFSRGQS